MKRIYYILILIITILTALIFKSPRFYLIQSAIILLVFPIFYGKTIKLNPKIDISIFLGLNIVLKFESILLFKNEPFKQYFLDFLTQYGSDADFTITTLSTFDFVNVIFTTMIMYLLVLVTTKLMKKKISN